MADETLSALSQTFGSGYSTSDVMLLLDTLDATMAITGTDKGITVATFLAQYLNAGSNVTLTPGSNGVTIATPGAVSSVFTRTGPVVATSGDYSVGQVTGALATNGSGAALTGITGSQITGNISGNAASITGSITNSQISDLSSWAGSTSITTLGTIATGTIPGSLVSGNISGNAAIAAGSVTLADQANFAANSLMGNPTGSPAAPSAVTLAGGLAFSGSTLTGAAFSPLAGSTSITTLGTIATGTVPAANVSGLAASATTNACNASNITSGTLGVAEGGTGLGTLTAHAVMLGEGTSNPGFATIGTAGNVLTDQGASADPLFLAPATASSQSATLATTQNLTSSQANVDSLYITLPTAGTYLIGSTIRTSFSLVGVASNVSYIIAQFYDSTYPRVVPGSLSLLNYVYLQSTGAISYSTSPMGPVSYTVTGASVIYLQAAYVQQSGTMSSQQVNADGSGTTTLWAIRIS